MNRVLKIKVFAVVFLAVFSPFIDQCSAGGYLSWLTDLKGDNSGHAVGYFLTLPVSAEELSMGASSSCGSMDATDVCFFPANTALFDREYFSVTHLEWLLGLRKEYCGASFPIEDVGTVGFFSQIFTPGKFSNAYTIDEAPSDPSLIDFSIGASYARHFLHKSLSAGASVSYVESRLDMNAGRTFSLNTDVSFSPSPLFLMHLRAGNIGPKVSYTEDFPEPLPLQVAYAVAVNPWAFHEDLLPIVDPQFGMGVKKIADEPLIIGARAQGKFFKFISLKAGYEFTLGEQAGLPGLSAGLGLDRNYYGADFGWKKQSKEFGSVWSLSVNVRLKEAIAKKAEDYYFLARRYFEQGRLRPSLSNAKKAVKLDPNMWKAHTLISEINALERRTSGAEMAILYTGNVKGQFVPKRIENASFGGLARISSAIRDCRAQFPLTLTVDAGNSLIQSSQAAKSPLADWFFDYCDYQARGFGKGEMDFGADRIFTKGRKANTDFIGSNLAGSFGKEIAGKKIVTVGKYSFALVAAVDPSAFFRPEDRENLLSPVEEITSILSKSAVKKADVRMLILSGSWEFVTAMINALPRVDIVLCANLKQKFESPMKIGNALVISPGDGGYCLGKLILRFDAGKKIVSSDNHLIALSEDVPPDPAVTGKLPTLGDGGDSLDDVTGELAMKKGDSSGVFCFVSDRDSTPGIYLKVLHSRAEFPLTRGRGSCSRPIPSFTCGKCLYFEKQSDTACAVLRAMDLSGVNKWTIPFNGCITEAAFSPNGKWIYFCGRTDSTVNDIYRVKPGQATVTPIIAWKNSFEGSMAFSPDGRFLVFASNGGNGRQLFLADTAGFKPICLTEGNADNFAPCFNPSGEYLAFLSNKTSFHGSYDLWVYSVAAGTMSQATFRSKVKDYCWRGDGKAIVYSSGDSLMSLKTMTIGGGEGIELIRTGLPKNYRESHPRTMLWRNAVKIIYTREYRDGEKKIYWVNPDGTQDACFVDGKGRDWIE